MVELAREVRRRHLGLWLVGGVNLALGVLFLLLIPFDERTVTGINVWIKPAKFCASVGIYLWTVAWFLPHLRLSPRVRAALGWAIALTMVLEMALLLSQAARGTSSHFNFATAYDAAVFGAMGMLIGINSLLVFVLLLLFLLRPAEIERTYLWGIRLGLLVLLLGSAQGGMMIGRGGHTVGAADGGPGLPFLSWSTEAGDLRPAHLVGLHGLQILPLAGFLLGRRRQWPARRRLAALFAFAAAYTLVGVALLSQALAGRPLIPL